MGYIYINMYVSIYLSIYVCMYICMYLYTYKYNRINRNIINTNEYKKNIIDFVCFFQPKGNWNPQNKMKYTLH